jgi:hypothetical protein
MGKTKTFSCCYFPCLTVLLVYAPCDVRTVVAAACGAGLLLIGCWRQSGKRAENRKRRGRRMVVGFTYYLVLLLWCVFGFSGLLIFPIFVLMHFSVFRFRGREAIKQRWSVPPKSHSGPSLSFYPGQTVLQSMLDNLMLRLEACDHHKIGGTSDRTEYVILS